jgi:hypothetical protein
MMVHRSTHFACATPFLCLFGLNQCEVVMKKVCALCLILGLLAGQAAWAEDGLVDKATKEVKKGLEAAEKGIKTGVEATERGVKKGAVATGEGFKTAGEWVEKKTGK